MRRTCVIPLSRISAFTSDGSGGAGIVGSNPFKNCDTSGLSVMVQNETRRRISICNCSAFNFVLGLCVLCTVVVQGCNEADYCGVDSNCNRLLSLPITKGICGRRDVAHILGYKENFYCPDSPFHSKKLAISEVCGLEGTLRRYQADWIKDPEDLTLFMLLGCASLSFILAVKV